MAERCAVVGVGQTKHATTRELSMGGLCREAIDRALEDAQVTVGEVDAVVMGKAPDMFEGSMMPELSLTEALGAVGKPLIRVHTAGSVGGSTVNVGVSLIEAGIHERVLVVGWEKQSDAEAMWVLSPKVPFSNRMGGGAGGAFAPYIRAYMRRSGAPDDIGILVALKDKANAHKNPYAHLQLDLTYDDIKGSPMLWDPVRFHETCPSSDGACAMVLANEAKAHTSAASPAWVLATANRSEPMAFPGRDTVLPRAGRDCSGELYQKAGITDPLRQIDVAEIYVPFSWFEPMWLENLGFAPENEGWKYVESGVTQLGGDLPVNPSGGVLSSNPVGASGTLRFAEAALQVRGQAGEHQVDGVRVAMGHAYGGLSQYFAMWLLGAEKP